MDITSSVTQPPPNEKEVKPQIIPPQEITIAEAIHRIQFFLIDSSCPAGHLIAAAPLLSRPDYDDVVVERSIAGLCGYPPCSNPLPADRDRRGRFRVSLREHRVYDLEETYKYCSEACVISSRAFTGSLNAERVEEATEAKIEQVLRLFGYGKGGEEELGEEWYLGLKGLSIKEKGDARAGEVSLDEWIGPATAIDGYVPQRDRIGDFGSNFIPNEDSWNRIEGAGDSQSPFASSIIVSNQACEIHSDASSHAKQEVPKVRAKKMEKACIAEKEARPKKAASKTSKFKSKKKSEDHESRNMDYMSSIITRNELNDQKTLSIRRHDDISEMIAKQLEDVILEETKTRKKKATSRLSKFEHHEKWEGATNQVGFSSSITFGDDVDAVTGKASSLSSENSSEAIVARRIEDSDVVEKHTSKNSSKSSKHKANKKKSGNDSDKLILDSFAITRDRADVVASNQSSPTQVLSMEINGGLADGHSGKESEKTVVNISNSGVCLGKKASSNEPYVKAFEGKMTTEKETILEEKRKSSLKASGSRVGNHSVKWADEKHDGSLEDRKIIPHETFQEDFDNSVRFTSAEACAAALIQAAEAVASGEVETGNAVSEAGILILPHFLSVHGEREVNEDMVELDEGIVKWPKETVLLDTDMFEVQDFWHDTPPEGFSLNLSSFATMWMSLFGWINCSSLAYIYGCDESCQKDFMLVNGKEYLQKVTLRGGQSLEIRQTLESFICLILLGLVKDFKLPIPVSTLEKFMSCLLDTMSFVDAIPSFKIRQWYVIILLFFEALSVHRLPVLAPHLMSKGMLLQQVLNAAEVSNEEYEIMRDLILPLGRLPESSLQDDGKRMNYSKKSEKQLVIRSAQM